MLYLSMLYNMSICQRSVEYMLYIITIIIIGTKMAVGG